MIKTLAILLCALILTACASMSMQGQPMKQIVVAESTFNVYMRSDTDLVEAHRVSVEPLPSKLLTLSKAVRAIELATGCRLKDGTLEGDQAIIKAKVDCVLP